MNVPFLDVGAGYAELQSELETAILIAFRSGQYIGGAEVEAFESAFAKYTGALNCIAVANGLDALHLGLLALGVKAGDEVIVPSNTFIATWLAVSNCGAIPVPVEPDRTTMNIEAESILRAITPKTRAIIPVHLYGLPVDIDPILELAKERNLFVLEDAAQAHGARYKTRRVGAHGHAVAWSFYPGKNLGALGDAGAVTTNDSFVARRVGLLRNYGSHAKYVHDARGFNSRMDPVQAAALRVKLSVLDNWNARRSHIAQLYTQGLASREHIVTPIVPDWAQHAWHLYVIQSPARDEIQKRLLAAGINTQIHYPIPPHLQGAYADMGFGRGAFPIAERLADESLSLPIGPHLSDESVSRVLAVL